MVLWTDDPGDYEHPSPDVLLKRTLAKISPGGILLLHDGIEETIQILPALLDALHRKGYTIVMLDRLSQTAQGNYRGTR